MIEELLVRMTVRIAVALWMIGAIARAVTPLDADGLPFPNRRSERLYRSVWPIGALLMIAHIVAAYGMTHGWSHAAAVAATAEESFQVTGIRAGWGVWVNFAFAASWLIQAAAMLWLKRRVPRHDGWLIALQGSIILAATVVFEFGVIRYAAAFGFLVLAVSSVVAARRGRSSGTESGQAEE